MWPPPSPLEEGTHGDPGLYGPGSAVWTIGRERVLLAGGQSALLMQVAHPLVAAGVASHSDFHADPFARLRATLDAMLTIAFGDVSQARAAAARVSAVHARVRGRLPGPAGPFPAGTPYRATDPSLSLWVHATLVHTSIEAYARFVRRPPPSLFERYYQETKRQTPLFGIPDRLLAISYQHFLDYVRKMVEGPDLTISEDARSLAAAVLHPPVPAVLRPAAAAARVIAVGMLPAPLRERFGLRWGPAERAEFVSSSAAVRTARRLMPRSAREWPHAAVAARRVRG